MRSCLGWRGKTSRSSSRSGRLRVEHHQLVAVGGRGEVTEPRAGLQVVLLAPHALEPRREVLGHEPLPFLALHAAPAPVQLEQDVAVEVGVHVVQVDVDVAHAPEGRLGHGDVDPRRGAHRGIGDRRAVVDLLALLAQLARLVARLCEQARARLLVHELVDRRQPDEGVLAVEDARLVDLVRVLALRVQDAAAEVAVDRRAADQHRELEPALVQLLHAGRHLLRGRDEQRREPDRVGLVLDRRVDDRVDRHLLAEVDHRVAVVGQDRVDERLADVVHVAEHRRDHDLALGVALDPLEVVLELRHRALHDGGRLEHERQDQLAGAELVAHLLHRGQQHVVERRNRADLVDGAVDPVLHALLAAPKDVEVERLLGLHALGRVARRLLLGLALLLEVGDEALERVLATG